MSGADLGHLAYTIVSLVASGADLFHLAYTIVSLVALRAGYVIVVFAAPNEVINSVRGNSLSYGNTPFL